MKRPFEGIVNLFARLKRVSYKRFINRYSTSFFGKYFMVVWPLNWFCYKVVAILLVMFTLRMWWAVLWCLPSYYFSFNRNRTLDMPSLPMTRGLWIPRPFLLSCDIATYIIESYLNLEAWYKLNFVFPPFTQSMGYNLFISFRSYWDGDSSPCEIHDIVLETTLMSPYITGI